MMKLKSNNYNNLLEIKCDNNTPIVFKYIGECTNVYNNNEKLYMNVKFSPSIIDDIVNFENKLKQQYIKCVSEHKTFSTNINNNELTSIKIPRHYNHISIPIKTKNDEKLLFEHLENGVMIHIYFTPSFIWQNNDIYGITWLTKYIKTNITYINK